MTNKEFNRGLKKLVERGARVRYWLNKHCEIIGVRVTGLDGIPNRRMSAAALVPYLT